MNKRHLAPLLLLALASGLAGCNKMTPAQQQIAVNACYAAGLEVRIDYFQVRCTAP